MADSETTADAGVIPGFAALLEKTGSKDRANLQRHLDGLAAVGLHEHSESWQRLVLALANLASHALQAVGQDAIRFFIADGRYRLQIFALEDKRDGQIQIVLPDVLDEAIKKKLIAKSPVESEYAVPKVRGETLRIESLDANNTVDPAAHYKFMIGLNRRALKVTIPAVGRPDRILLVEALCKLAVPAGSAPAAPAK